MQSDKYYNDLADAIFVLEQLFATYALSYDANNLIRLLVSELRQLRHDD